MLLSIFTVNKSHVQIILSALGCKQFVALESLEGLDENRFGITEFGSCSAVGFYKNNRYSDLFRGAGSLRVTRTEENIYDVEHRANVVEFDSFLSFAYALPPLYIRDNGTAQAQNDLTFFYHNRGPTVTLTYEGPTHYSCSRDGAYYGGFDYCGPHELFPLVYARTPHPPASSRDDILVVLHDSHDFPSRRPSVYDVCASLSVTLCLEQTSSVTTSHDRSGQKIYTWSAKGCFVGDHPHTNTINIWRWDHPDMLAGNQGSTPSRPTDLPGRKQVHPGVNWYHFTCHATRSVGPFLLDITRSPPFIGRVDLSSGECDRVASNVPPHPFKIYEDHSPHVGAIWVNGQLINEGLDWDKIHEVIEKSRKMMFDNLRFEDNGYLLDWELFFEQASPYIDSEFYDIFLPSYCSWYKPPGTATDLSYLSRSLAMIDVNGSVAISNRNTVNHFAGVPPALNKNDLLCVVTELAKEGRFKALQDLITHNML